MTHLEHVIDTAWETRSTLSPQSAPAAVGDAVGQVIAGLDAGRLRVAEKIGGAWTTHQWIKKAVLLSFRLTETGAMRFERRAGSAEPFAFYDKVPTKFAGLSDDQLAAAGVRIVPPAEPSVDAKYSRPADCPERSMLSINSRTAYGETMPKNTVGALNISNAASSKP